MKPGQLLWSSRLGEHVVSDGDPVRLLERRWAYIYPAAPWRRVGSRDRSRNPPPFPGLPAGREGLKEAFRIFWEATPGRHEIEDQIAEGDKVATRLTAYGRHEGELPGPLPATGADMRETAVAIHRIANGRIAEHWSDRDDLVLMQQLGVISLPGG